MADCIDIANEQVEYHLQVALQRRVKPAAASAECCDDCGEAIPLLRQQMVQGCRTCVECQTLREQRR